MDPSKSKDDSSSGREAAPTVPFAAAGSSPRERSGGLEAQQERERGGAGPDETQLDVAEAFATEAELPRTRIGEDPTHLPDEREGDAGGDPTLAAGDIGVSVNDANFVGEEAPGMGNPSPDQDLVDAIGEASGLEYADDETINPEEKLAARDAQRWELEPESSEDFSERSGTERDEAGVREEGVDEEGVDEEGVDEEQGEEEQEEDEEERRRRDSEERDEEA